MEFDIMNILAPLQQSTYFDDSERELKQLFIAMIKELFEQQLVNIFHYGIPEYSDDYTVIERFTKQNGLAVLHRDLDEKHRIMRILYETWQALPSKRGLFFLEFMLTMLYGNDWSIQRLYQPVSQLEQYPQLATAYGANNPNYFLTSRINVLLPMKANMREMESLAHSIKKLVPANIVADVGGQIALETSDIWVAGGADFFCVAYLMPEWE